MTIRIAINGFGRIGRYVARAVATDANITLVGINDLTDSATLAHLLKYDSIFRIAPFAVKASEGALSIAGKTVTVTKEKDPSKLPWKDQRVDIVLECTGRFTDRDAAAAHLTAGAKKVIVSAPAKDADLTVCFGVNHATYDAAKHHVLSNASCTTNCLAPIAKVLHDAFGIERGFMTTIHSYTNDQQLMDSPHKDLRRARAAALSQIPTSTGAAKAVGLVLPALKGKLDGIAIRVPTPNVSCLDFTAQLTKPASAEQVNAALKDAADGGLRGVLAYSELPLVSCDYLDNHHSSIVDALSTASMDNLVKVLAWYDNEAGFSRRLIDVVQYIGARL